MRTKVTAIIKDKDSQWTEPFYLDGKVTEEKAKDQIQEIVEIFNGSIRQTELPRELVEVTEITFIP